jgi:hypothetical protein
MALAPDVFALAERSAVYPSPRHCAFAGEARASAATDPTIVNNFVRISVS